MIRCALAKRKTTVLCMERCKQIYTFQRARGVCVRICVRACLQLRVTISTHIYTNPYKHAYKYKYKHIHLCI